MPASAWQRVPNWSWLNRAAQHGQHPARHGQRDDEAGDGEQAELGEACEARQQHRAEAADRGQHAEPQRWPDARRASRQIRHPARSA